MWDRSHSSGDEGIGVAIMRGVFFGLEYDNDAIPHAIVVPGTRSGKFVKWVNQYIPKEIIREDGKKVLRERQCVQLPERFRLRKDEILGQKHDRRLDSYQDAKFYVLKTHMIGVYLHPSRQK